MQEAGRVAVVTGAARGLGRVIASTLAQENYALVLAEVEHARRMEVAADSLDMTAHDSRWGEDVSPRFVMLHLIHEYARHNGHADLLREGIDGTVGV